MFNIGSSTLLEYKLNLREKNRERNTSGKVFTHKGCSTWQYIHTLVVRCGAHTVLGSVLMMYIYTWVPFVQLYTQKCTKYKRHSIIHKHTQTFLNLTIYTHICGAVHRLCLDQFYSCTFILESLLYKCTVTYQKGGQFVLVLNFSKTQLIRVPCTSILSNKLENQLLIEGNPHEPCWPITGEY